jgi:hypothetical protein
MTQLNPNDALVDYSGILKTVGDLQDEFSLLNLLDYCAIVEGLVLHDRLVMVGATDHSKSQESRIAVKITEKLAPWLSANVLVYDPDPAPIQDVRRLTNDLVTIGNRTRGGRTLDVKLEDAFFESGRLIASEKSRRRPALPLLRQVPYYEKQAQVLEDHAVCNLVGKYKTLKEAIEDIRDRSRLPMQPYIAVPIPPLALLALKRCRRPSDLTTVVLEIRDDFASLRSSLNSLREFLLDSSVSPTKKLSLIESWERSWKSLDEYQRSATLLQLAQSSNQMLDANELFDGLEVDDIKWTKVLEKVLQQGEKSLCSWRIRMLHRTAKRYLATSDSEVNKAIEVIFQRQVCQADVFAVKSFCDSLREPRKAEQSGEREPPVTRNLKS